MGMPRRDHAHKGSSYLKDDGVAREESGAHSEAAAEDLGKIAGWIDGAGLSSELSDAIWEGVAAHAGELKAVPLIAQPADPAVVKKALDPAIDLTGVECVQKLVGLHDCHGPRQGLSRLERR